MGGKRGVQPLPLVPPSGDAEIISVVVHSTPGSRDPPFQAEHHPLLEAQPLCRVQASRCQPAPNPALGSQSKCHLSETSVASPSTR